jgi:hypothetical protein
MVLSDKILPEGRVLFLPVILPFHYFENCFLIDVPDEMLLLAGG